MYIFNYITKSCVCLQSSKWFRKPTGTPFSSILTFPGGWSCLKRATIDDLLLTKLTKMCRSGVCDLLNIDNRMSVRMIEEALRILKTIVYASLATIYTCGKCVSSWFPNCWLINRVTIARKLFKCVQWFFWTVSILATKFEYSSTTPRPDAKYSNGTTRCSLPPGKQQSANRKWNTCLLICFETPRMWSAKNSHSQDRQSTLPTTWKCSTD